MYRIPASVVIFMFVALAAVPTWAESADALKQVVDRYPGVLVFDGAEHRDTDTRVIFYGKAMNSGRTASEAAEAWLRNHSTAIGARYSELVRVRENEIQGGLKIVFAYEQVIGGVRVEGSRGRVVVLSPERDGAPWQVTYVAAIDMAKSPEEGFPALGLGGTDAIGTVRALEAYSDLDQWSSAHLVILPPGENLTTTTRAWKFEGRNSDRKSMRSFTFYVDAAEGTLIRWTTNIHHEDVDGTITGMGTPGLQADAEDNPPVETALPGVTVSVAGGESQFAGDDGTYLFTDLDAEDQDIEVILEGEWVTVIPSQGAALTGEETVLPPDTLDIVLNEDEEEFDTAQVNAFVHTQQTHDFFVTYATDYTGIDEAIDCYVNIDSACNAYFDTFGGVPSINFFNAGFSFGTECSNTAFSNVITHEYGHYIVYTLGLSQNAFGEGYSDCLAILRFDDPIIGEDFFGEDTFVRDVVGANQQYPCDVFAVHTCGQILGGVWWDLRLNLESTLGDADEGLEAARELFGDWSLITVAFTGGEPYTSADPGTAIEVLEANDDNGNIYDSTPDFDDICDAFDEHSIDCPEVDNVSITFPDGVPGILNPDGSTSFTVLVAAVIEEPVAGSAYVAYSTNGSAYDTEFLDSDVDNEYTVEIPVDSCGDTIDFYIGVEDDSGAETTFPRDTDEEVFSAIVAVDQIVAFEDDFEEAGDWTVGDDDDPDDAATGAWERVDPNGNFVVPQDDHTEDGTMCFVTEQHSPGDSVGDHDIDAGKTTLVSPLLDLSEVGAYYISYWRWFSNNGGASPYDDEFLVEISEDGGLSWVNVETVGPGSPADPTGVNGGWNFHRFNVAEFIEPTEEVIVRFIASDELPGSLVEAAVDDFIVEHYTCTDDGVPDFSRGDCNDSGAMDIADAIYLLEVLFGSLGFEPTCEDACDGDDDGDIDLPDVFDILGATFAGEDLPAPYQSCGDDATDADDITCDSFESC